MSLKVVISRAEGRIDLCNKKHEFASFTEAKVWLRSWSHTFPSNGCYDKHDLWVYLDDELWYTGRLDCKSHVCDDNDLDVKEHIQTSLIWYAGLTTKPHCGYERYNQLCVGYEKEGTAEECRRMLETLSGLK